MKYIIGNQDDFVGKGFMSLLLLVWGMLALVLCFSFKQHLLVFWLLFLGDGCKALLGVFVDGKGAHLILAIAQLL